MQIIKAKILGETEILDNLVIATSGKGIDYSATGDLGGITSELLDDYEEGTWTPALSFGGGTVGLTYTTQDGTYIKVGNLVTVIGKVTLSAKGTSTGSAIMTLPFTAASGNAFNSSIAFGATSLISFADMLQGLVQNNTFQLYFYESTNGGVRTTLNHTNFNNGSEWNFSASYRVA